MKQGETTELQVKGEIHERMTNNKKRQSPEFSGNGKHRKFRSSAVVTIRYIKTVVRVAHDDTEVTARLCQKN